MTLITSKTNSKIKQIIKLRDRRARDEAGMTIIEGRKEIDCAAQAGVRISELYYCPQYKINKGLLTECRKQGSELHEVSADVFDRIAFGDRKEGIIALARPELRNLSRDVLSEAPFVVVVERVEKPGNLGAILRSCDGAGVDAVIVSDIQTDVFNPNVIRASLGAVFTVPVIQSKNPTIADFLKKNKIKSFAATPEAKKDYAKADYRSGVALIVGAEHEGLSSFWLKNADEQIKIPMAGRGDSLNVSASSAVLIYEVVRQRNT